MKKLYDLFYIFIITSVCGYFIELIWTIDRNIFYRDEKSREAYYFEDFLNTLSIHKTESNYEMIRRRFINAINNTKENK